MRFTSKHDGSRLRATRVLPVLTVSALTLAACVSDQVSLGNGEPSDETVGSCLRSAHGIVEGDVQVSTQAELDELAGCTEVTGSLDIRTSSMLDLQPLAELRVVRGTLRIEGEGNPLPVSSLQGLERLQRVGELFLIKLDIESLAPLANLVEVRPDPLANPPPILASVGLAPVYIRECPRVVDLSGLENLVVWDDLEISDMPGLESLRGMVATRRGQQLSVQRTPNLRDLAALGAATSMDSVSLRDTGIESFLLEVPLNIRRLELSRNPSLVNLDGLGSLQGVEELVIVDNDRLEQLPELPYLAARSLSSLRIGGNDSLRSVPAWVLPDEADFLPYSNVGEPNGPEYFFPPEFRMAEITDNAQLTALALPTIFRFGGRVRINDNPSLTTLDLRYATDIEHLYIRDNAALVHVDISALENVDDLHVVNNPGLAPSIFDGVDSRTTEMDGNLDAPVP